MKTNNSMEKDTDVAGPDFIGIGAARCGTTWLASSLSHCKEVWLPRRKELHYFSRSSAYPSPSYLEAAHCYTRLFGLGEGSARFRTELIKALGGDILRRSWSQMRWDLRYFLGQNDVPTWYNSLFPQSHEGITGEITPAYSLLDDADVAAISARYPRLKIIYIIRNPVDRAWSTICYHQKRTGQSLTQQGEGAVIEYLTRSAIEQRSDYLTVVRRWRQIHGTDKFFLAYYDDLINEPAELLQRLLTFLDIQTTDVLPLAGKINSSVSIPMPPTIASALAKRYLTSVERLADVTGGPVTKWVEELKAYASD